MKPVNGSKITIRKH